MLSYASHSGRIVSLAAVSLYVLFRLTKTLMASRLPKKQIVADSPILLSYFSNDSQIVGLDSGNFGDLSYVLLTTKTDYKNANNHAKDIVPSSGGVIVCRVSLPFQTGSHLVGIAKNGSKELGLDEFLARRNLETIELEGNFSEHTALFAPPGNQFNARYLLDPKAMAFVIDFCRTHHWEIINDELYFVTNDSLSRVNNNDPTPIMTDDIERFVEEIKPALVILSDSRAIHASRQYGQPKSALKCPRCGEELIFKDRAFHCKNNHGMLISGQTMMAIRNEGVKRLQDESVSSVKHQPVECPNCQNTMVMSNYQNTKIEIDICMHCGYRWLDNGEEVILYG